MRKLMLTVAATAALASIGSYLARPAQAAMPTAPAAIGVAADAVDATEKAGCYRLGLTGYHWYSFCAGPSFLYPHHRAWRHGHWVYW